MDAATTEGFVALRLSGDRFTAIGLPAAALHEVLAYEDLLREVAKAVFLRKHPGRERVPKASPLVSTCD